MKKCNYRNCNSPIKGRSNKKYCNTSCRKMEQTYDKREQIKFQEEHNKIKEFLEIYNSQPEPSVIELWNKIYDPIKYRQDQISKITK